MKESLCEKIPIIIFCIAVVRVLECLTCFGQILFEQTKLSEARRSWNMSRIRSKNTKPEILMRSALYKLGFRFRLHVKDLPGKPDIVLPKHKTVIFVHGCFWHQHGCSNSKIPSTRANWWKEKLDKNKQRDQEVESALRELGWRVIIVWECEIRKTGVSTENIIEEICIL